MTDNARAYFDAVRDLAGDPARRVREFADRLRDDVRSGGEGLKSGAEQLREHGSRTASDLGRLIRAEFAANLTRLGVATQADLDDLNLRLEHSEDQVRDLRLRLAEAEARLKEADKPTAQPEPAAATAEPEALFDASPEPETPSSTASPQTGTDPISEQRTEEEDA